MAETLEPVSLLFLPTPSARRATGHFYRVVGSERISTHALREEGDTDHPFILAKNKISTHALREEGDRQRIVQRLDEADFYPRPPRGGRPVHNSYTMTAQIFLPTPSARRATDNTLLWHSPQMISTHALREEGDKMQEGVDMTTGISTHALREEGDPAACPPRTLCSDFYPRPPRGGRRGRRRTHPGPEISTHALREEGDILPRVPVGCQPDFYPRPPRGGRRIASKAVT